ncbi:MAG TPA: tryptophan halogenase family protein [Allosphingosinicella sp.]|jgi:tryptophan halogenase
MLPGEQIRKIVIVGGGTAGWMAAAALKQHFRSLPVSVTVVESSEIGTVGVGEATIPTIRRFYAGLGMRDWDVLDATEGTAKLGIRFNGWAGEGTSFLHPFGHFGQDVRGIGFHHYWLKLRAAGGDAGRMEDYSLGASLALGGRFTPPSPNPPSPMSLFDWALHLDASLFAGHLRRFAEAAGCARIDSRIEKVHLRGSDGFIQSLSLANGETVEGDLFIDCSGFRSLLLGDALGVPFEDWSHWLLCDSAIAVQSQGTGSLPPYTSVTARRAGWQWHIPLQHRTGNGIVFSSRHIGEEDARAELLGTVEGALLTEPRRLGFTPGRRRQAWAKNCVALGLASGFLEPLESTSIALIETGIERLKQLFPDRRFDPAVIDEYNEISGEEMERVRDFIILHYKLNKRSGTFWEECRQMAVPETLARKMQLFAARGHFVRYRWEMFAPASWLAIYAGFGHWPEGYDPGADALDGEYLRRSLAEMRRAVAGGVAEAPGHADFLARWRKVAEAELAAAARRAG